MQSKENPIRALLDEINKQFSYDKLKDWPDISTLDISQCFNLLLRIHPLHFHTYKAEWRNLAQSLVDLLCRTMSFPDKSPEHYVTFIASLVSFLAQLNYATLPHIGVILSEDKILFLYNTGIFAVTQIQAIQAESSDPINLEGLLKEEYNAIISELEQLPQYHIGKYLSDFINLLTVEHRAALIRLLPDSGLIIESEEAVVNPPVQHIQATHTIKKLRDVKTQLDLFPKDAKQILGPISIIEDGVSHTTTLAEHLEHVTSCLDNIPYAALEDSEARAAIVSYTRAFQNLSRVIFQSCLEIPLVIKTQLFRVQQILNIQREMRNPRSFNQILANGSEMAFLDCITSAAKLTKFTAQCSEKGYILLHRPYFSVRFSIGGGKKSEIDCLLIFVAPQGKPIHLVVEFDGSLHTSMMKSSRDKQKANFVLQHLGSIARILPQDIAQSFLGRGPALRTIFVQCVMDALEALSSRPPEKASDVLVDMAIEQPHVSLDVIHVQQHHVDVSEHESREGLPLTPTIYLAPRGSLQEGTKFPSTYL